MPFNNKMALIGTDNSMDLSSVVAFQNPEFVFINKLFRQFDYEIRVAGGAVRDILMGMEPKDIDLATTATPAQMVELFTKENLRILNRNGEAHGTVTVRLNDKVNYEITTLRVDSNHDGRHASVSFTTDWQVDASRRDLTVNSMFISVSFDNVETEALSDCTKFRIRGKLYDFFNGYEDLARQRIRFVGEPSERIKEDYLRILRYFRFHARLAASPDDHDEATLTAIAKNSKGLENISGERIWVELKLIFGYPPAPSLIGYMGKTGVARACGLPEKPNLTEMNRIFVGGLLSRHPNPATCVAAAFNSVDEVETMILRIRPSNLEQNILHFLVKWRQHLMAESNILERMHREYLLSLDQARLKPVFDEVVRYFCTSDDVNAWLAWQAPRFPLSGTMVSEKWNIKGRQLRPLLQGLRKVWVDSECTMGKEELMADELFQKLSQMPLGDENEYSMTLCKKQKR